MGNMMKQSKKGKENSFGFEEAFSVSNILDILNSRRGNQFSHGKFEVLSKYLITK